MAFPGSLAAITPRPRNPDRAGDRRAVAYPGDTAESAVLRFHDAQRTRRVPRFFLVLFLQRAPVAILESALSARLQYRAPAVLLAAAPGVAVPLERVLARSGETGLPARGSRFPHTPVMPLLGRISAGVLHLLLDAGVLFNAVLSRAGAADRERAHGKAHGSVDSGRPGRVGRGGHAGAGGDRLHPLAGVEPSGSGRYFPRADPASG